MVSGENLSDFKFERTRALSLRLVRALIEVPSLNDFLQETLPEVGEAFGTSRIVLVDYREQIHRFVLLHFEGYPADHHYDLQRRVLDLDLALTLDSGRPCYSQEAPAVLYIPLYFADTLEALLLLEGDEKIKLDEARLEVASLLSKFLGLLMSSTRLTINRDQILDHEDLQRARRIQLSYLPDGQHATESFELYGYNSSSALVGGDYFDYFPGSDGGIRCVLADAVGHGMAAALIMSNFRGLLQSELGRATPFGPLFDRINETIHSGEELIQYLTGVFLDIEPDSIQYLNAGHYEPLIFAADGRVRSLSGGGPPIGMFKGINYTVQRAELHPGELIALFTDGLVEIQDSRQEHFGIGGITEGIKKRMSSPLPLIAGELLAEARDFSAGPEQDDDVTLLLIRRR